VSEAKRQDRDGPASAICAGVVAYVLWGLIPLYFKTVATVAPVEVLAHRAVWSFVVLVVVVCHLRRWREVCHDLCNPKLMLMLIVSASMISATWLTFIYTVAKGEVLQASLGYFISPVINILLGVAFLRERLRPFQVVAVGLATVGILVRAWLIGQMPWLALLLAATTALHVLMRQITPVDGLTSLAFETLIMTPVAIFYLGYAAMNGELTGNAPELIGLLTLSGPVTTVPFLFFGIAVKVLRLSTMGIIQYLMPTLQFLLAVALFHEPFSWPQLLSFVCVWTAIAIYTIDSYRATRQSHPPSVEPSANQHRDYVAA
jgi:chloramphenicol-sensitive protein RarD